MTGGSRRTATEPHSITGRVTGAQTGAVLAFVSSGILGQYDPFAVERRRSAAAGVPERDRRRASAAGVSPPDFRLWVCLHEVTHRVQFRANPWLAEHMSQCAGGADRRTPARTSPRWSAGWPTSSASVATGATAIRTRIRAGILGFMRAVQSEPQRAALDQLLVLGTLLEGHADHVMDAVGPAVVPSVATIRRRFDRRRAAQAAAAAAAAARAARHRRQDEPVHPRQGVRRPRGRPRSAWTGSTPSGRARTPCRCPTKSKIRSDGSTGCCSAAAGRRGRRSRRRTCPTRRPLVRRAVGRPRLAGADGGRRGDVMPTTALIVDHGLQPDSAAVAETARATGHRRWDALTHRCFASRSAPTGGPEAAARTARYAALDAARGDAPVLLGAHPRRPGRDRAARPRPRLGRPLDRRYAAVRPAVVPAAAGRAARGHPRRVRRTGTRRRGTTRTTPTAGSPGPGCAPRCCRCSRTCSAAGWPRRWRAPRPRCARTPTHSTSSPTRALADADGDAPDCRSPRWSALPEAVRRRVIRGWLLRGRRQRADRQADPRRRHSGHRLARAGRGGGRLARCAASGCSPGAATEC